MLHGGNHLFRDNLRSLGAREEDRSYNEIRTLHRRRDVLGIRRKCVHASVKHGVELTESFQRTIDNRHIGAHTERNLRGVGADDATPDHHHLGTRDTRDAGEERSTATVGFLEIVGADLDRHASGHFAHRR
jgi:hypothetical protein